MIGKTLSRGFLKLCYGLTGGSGGGSTPPPPAPVADFTGTPLSGSDPLTVTFTDTSTNTPTSWLWEKNDGSGWVNFDGTPTAQNPVEDFAQGSWSVRLTASNAGGSNTKTQTDYIVVGTQIYFGSSTIPDPSSWGQVGGAVFTVVGVDVFVDNETLIGELYPSGQPELDGVFIFSAGNMQILDVSGTNITELDLSCDALVTLMATDCPAITVSISLASILMEINFTNSFAGTFDESDAIVSINALGTSNGELILTGCPAPLSGAGNVAKLSLITRGWTVIGPP